MKIKTAFILLALFVFAVHIKAERIKYIILFIGDGMSSAAECSLSRFVIGKDGGLVWNKFPVRTFVATWSKSSYMGEYDENNFNAVNGYDIFTAGAEPYPYYFSLRSEKYFDDSKCTDSAAAASAMSTGKKFFNGSVCFSADSKARNISDIVNETGEFNIAIITTAFFYDATAASFASHNKSRYNYKQIAEEMLSQTKPALIFGKTGYFYLKDFAADKGYYVVDSSDIDRPQIFGVVKNKNILINLNNYSVPDPDNRWDVSSFSYKQGCVNFESMIRLSLNLLLEKKEPFFAMAEQSDIDLSCHDNDFFQMLGSMHELYRGVEYAVNLIDSQTTDMNWDNTLLIVTADQATGYLRFKEFMRKGRLPPKNIILGREILKLNDSVEYKSKNHTNELVACYAIGANSQMFNKYKGKYYKDADIIDNTDIFKVLSETLRNGVSPQ